VSNGTSIRSSAGFANIASSVCKSHLSTMTNHMNLFRIAVPILWSALLICSAHANPVGNFTVVKGRVDASRADSATALQAEVGMDSFMKDVIRTRHRSRTQLEFVDTSLLNMGQDFIVEINEYLFDATKKVRKGVLRSLRGTVRATIAKVGDGKNSSFEVETPTAVAAARGTDFIVIVHSSEETEVVVLEGVVAVRNIDHTVGSEVLVKAGERTIVRKKQRPTPPALYLEKYAQLLVRRTTPDMLAPPQKGGDILASAEMVPIPSAPIDVPTSPKQFPDLAGIPSHPPFNGLPPVQPLPYLFTPVSLILVF